MQKAKVERIILPVVAAGAEFLVMGLLMRRNILVYKAPQNNEGYDFIAIHPEPRHVPSAGERAQVRIQVKSRLQTDCNRLVLLKEKSLDAFDFLVIVFMNIGKFYGRNDGSSGDADFEVYYLPNNFVRKYHRPDRKVQGLPLKNFQEEIEVYKGDKGIEMITTLLGITRPVRKKLTASRKRDKCQKS